MWGRTALRPSRRKDPVSGVHGIPPGDRRVRHGTGRADSGEDILLLFAGDCGRSGKIKWKKNKAKMHKGRKKAYTNGYRIIKGKIWTNTWSELSKTKPERRDNYSPLSGKIIGQDFIKGEFPHPSNGQYLWKRIAQIHIYGNVFLWRFPFAIPTLTLFAGYLLKAGFPQ